MSEPFKPSPAATVNINVSGTSQSVKLSDLGLVDVYIVNDGSATAWIEFGASDVAASASTGVAIPKGVPVQLRACLDDGVGELYVAAIAASTTGKIYFTPGRGGC